MLNEILKKIAEYYDANDDLFTYAIIGILWGVIAYEIYFWSSGNG